MKVSPVAMIYLAAGAAGLFVVYKLGRVAPGLLSGDNALTQGATNAAGEKTTAYQGAGVVGTVAAAANKASGGVLASAGEAIGGWFASFTGADKDAEIRDMLKGSAAASQARYQQPPVSNGQLAESPTPLSFLSMGGSFKDLSQPQDLNPWSDPLTYGGGVSFR